MPIRFKCRYCKKALAVKEQLAGRKAICPGCRKPIVIPKPKPSAAQVEELAAAMLGDGEIKKKPEKPKEAAPIKFTCEWCDENVEVPASEAGSKMPCPECKRIVRVPVPKEDKPKDWRDVHKKGPIGAKDNQPEAIDNAWGTEQARGATRQALEEADAIPITVESNNLGLWLKRGFWGTLTVGCVYLAVTGIIRSQSSKGEQDAVNEAVKLAAELKNGDWAAEIHRAAGEHYCSKDPPQPVLAKKHFHIALASLQSAGKPIADKDIGPIDVDLFLIDLALAQVELGGTDDEILDKRRLPWADVQRDLTQTLDSISKKSEAREKALRLVGVRLADRKQLALAIGLAGSSPVQRAGLDLAYRAYLEKAKLDKDKDVSQNALKALADMEKQGAPPVPFPKADGAIDKEARLAHVEALAREGKHKEALDLACDRREKTVKEAQQCLIACVSAAELALASKNPTEAAACVRKALELIDEVQKQEPVPKWWLFSAVYAGIEADVAEVQELAKTLDAPLQPHVRLANFRQKLSKASAALPTVDGKAGIEKEERELLCWPQAWEALARHNAQHHQSRVQVLALMNEADDQRLRAFLLVGFALGHRGK